MSDRFEAVGSLAGKHVWIVDDAIPVQQSKFDKDELLEGTRPIDRGTLQQLLTIGKWDDETVRALCQEVMAEGGNVTAFIQPSAAIDYLRRGGMVPDAIVFDLAYRGVGNDLVLKSLESLLSDCIAVVQVYSQEPTEVAKRSLQELSVVFRDRLTDPKNKNETDATVLSAAIKQQLDNSLPAQLARELRRLSLQAVEGVLVKLDDLPIAELTKLLGGQVEDHTAEETDLLELLSVKVSEGVSSNSELIDAISRYAIKAGIGEQQQSEIIQSIASLVVGSVREAIRGSGGLLALSDRWASSSPKRGNAPAQAQSQKIVKDFFQFRAYFSPPSTEKLVRTGDVVRVASKLGVREANSKAEPDLYLVVTPPCDLPWFWTKTRGVLTLARMCPINRRGLDELNSFTNRYDKNIPSSMTVGSAILMPSVRLQSGSSLDYVLFAHQLRFEKISKPEATPPKSPLTYDAVGDIIVRQCRVSEPFLSGILDQIKQVLFRPGIPDFPHEEQTRIKEALVEIKGKD